MAFKKLFSCLLLTTGLFAFQTARATNLVTITAPNGKHPWSSLESWIANSISIWLMNFEFEDSSAVVLYFCNSLLVYLLQKLKSRALFVKILLLWDLIHHLSPWESAKCANLHLLLSRFVLTYGILLRDNLQALQASFDRTRSELAMCCFTLIFQK